VGNHMNSVYELYHDEILMPESENDKSVVYTV
jgi:hypothetical protein